MFLFYLEHLAALLLVLGVAAATGTAVSGRRFPLALRSALGLAVAGQLFILLGSLGLLRPWSLATFTVVSLVAAAVRLERRWSIQWRGLGLVSLLFLPLFVLALNPPLAFDETMYHLPFVRALAESGRIAFLGGLRFPAFPQLQELLCVPLFLLLGEQAVHLVSLAEIIILSGVMVEWSGPGRRGVGLLAAAFVVGSPIVAQMATVTYAEAALMLFVGAGYCCLEWGVRRAESGDSSGHDSWSLAAAGLLLGSACSVKYLGWYFAGGGALMVLLFSAGRRRALTLFLAGLAAGALPMYSRIVVLSGSPFFPFMPRLFGTSPWAFALPGAESPGTRLLGSLRLCWDVTFARERLNAQPHFTPLFLVAVAVMLAAAFRNRRASFYSLLFIGYVAAFSFLPQDSRYLMPLIPIVGIVAATSLGSWFQIRSLPLVLLALIALPAPAYAIYRLIRQGPPPVTPSERTRFLEHQIPEYRALERRGPGRIYVCGAEQLKYYGADDLLGDVTGPNGNETVVGHSRNSAALARTLARMDARYLLMSRRASRPEWLRIPAAPEFEAMYSDKAAVLWRVR
jgi:hypothetical protein